MHRFAVAASGAPGQVWGAEWFQTTAGQICVQAGRQVGDRLGYADDGVFPREDRFHPFASNTAVNARCVDPPAHGGVALMVAERVADSGNELTASGACASAEHTPCRTDRTTTLYFGILGARAVLAGYGTEQRSRSLNIGPSGDGEYIEALPTAANACSVSPMGCHARFALPSLRAFVG